MRAYADTSFLVKLLTQEAGTATAVDDYRRLGRPPVFSLPLHGLEVANAIRQRAFHQRRTTASSERTAIKRECEAALSMLKKFIARGVFVEISVDMDGAIDAARALSEKHTLTSRWGQISTFNICVKGTLPDRQEHSLARLVGKERVARGQPPTVKRSGSLIRPLKGCRSNSLCGLDRGTSPELTQRESAVPGKDRVVLCYWPTRRGFRPWLALASDPEH